jgi:hypothetical protein
VARAVDSRADLRWGTERRGFRRIIHPNGICLTGVWEITEQTPYSGYFQAGSRALAIGRYSTCCKETRRGRERSLSLVGKLFPTTDPEHREPLLTANFITQQDLGGERTDYINDAELRNAPDTTSWRRGFGTPILLVEAILFNLADKQPTQRQLYQIDPAPKGSLTFHIEITDDGSTHGPAFFQRRRFANWRRVGRLVFGEAVASYNGDFVIHFNHPTWRDDRNDPSTAIRVNERRVR